MIRQNAWVAYNRHQDFFYQFTFWLVLFVALTFYHTAAFSQSSKPVFFTIQEKTNNDKMARKALGDFLFQSEATVGRHVPLGIAREDLNNDGIQELFVRLLDDDLFCEKDDCQVYIFAIQNNGFIKIADFKARSIDILDNKTNGTYDLQIQMSNQSKHLYLWKEGFYEKQS